MSIFLYDELAQLSIREVFSAVSIRTCTRLSLFKSESIVAPASMQTRMTAGKSPLLPTVLGTKARRSAVSPSYACACKESTIAPHLSESPSRRKERNHELWRQTKMQTKKYMPCFWSQYLLFSQEADAQLPLCRDQHTRAKASRQRYHVDPRR